MAYYRYTARDKAGKTVTAQMEAPDERTVINTLRKQELIIISIKPETKRVKSVKKSGRIKAQELVLFSRQLATMIEAGIPLVQSLEILTEQIESPRFRYVVSEVKKDVTVGATFYEALFKHPKVFSALFSNMVKAGEASGALSDIMDRLASYMEKTESLMRKVHSAMVYPIVVSCMAFIITAAMLLKVVPVFKDMFKDFGAQLPLPTQILVDVSDLLRNTFIFWVGGGVAGFILFKRFVKTPKGALLFDDFKLRMPLFGPIVKKVAVSKFCRTLATLIKSGVPILTALDIVGKTSGNRVLEIAVEKVKASVREGENITEPLMKVKVFPPLVVRMISVGEQTGQLEKMLSKVADFYDDQVDAAVAGLTSIIEPLIIAFLGVVVGGIMVCLFMPIFKLASVVQG